MDDHVRPVVVGVDGSEASHAAADYAAAVAHARSLPLHLVYGYLRKLTYHEAIDPLEMAEPEEDQTAARLMDDVFMHLSHKWPGLEVQIAEVSGDAAQELIDKSRNSELVVVGSRGRGGFRGLLLGSVSAKVAAHAHCPVVVVRPPGWSLEAPSSEGVVVGVDGSSESMLALEQASDEAVRLGQPLTVIHVSQANTTSNGPPNARTLLATALHQAHARHPDLLVRDELIHNAKPKDTLLNASKSANLVAVGSRGRDGFAGLLLGSLSQSLIQHSECPVLIAHHYTSTPPDAGGQTATPNAPHP